MRDPDHSGRPVAVGAFSDRVSDDLLPDIAEENQLIGEALQASEYLSWQPIPSASTQRVFDSLRYHRNHVVIFHFAGHATGDRLFFREMGTHFEQAFRDGFAEFLSHLPHLRLVFLNGCATQCHVESLTSAGVPAVVATSGEVEDKVAAQFAAEFYRSLASSVTVAEAYGEAKAALATYDPDHLASGSENEPWLWTIQGPGQEWRLQDSFEDSHLGLPGLPRKLLDSWPESPFRGLQPFEEEHAYTFFGRGNVQRGIYESLLERPSQVLLCYGQSGVGKTSLFRAGLIPRLRNDGWHVFFAPRSFEPGLVETLRKLVGEAEAAYQRRDDGAGRATVIIVDQVEEVFTRPPIPGNTNSPNAELKQFCESVAETLRSASVPELRLVLAFRKEWLPDLEHALANAGIVTQAGQHVFVQRLSRQEAVEAVRLSPLVRRQYGLEITDSLPSMIADSLLADPGSPVAPTLQMLLAHMWERANRLSRSHPCLSEEIFRQVSRDGVTLGDFFDAAITEIASVPENAEVVHNGLALDVLFQHVTRTYSGQRARDELRKAYQDKWPAVERLLRAFKRPPYNLLVDVPDEGPDDTQSTRLVHDTLAPVIIDRYKASEQSGKLARLILDAKAVQLSKQDAPTVLLDNSELELVDQGRDGTRTFTPEEALLVKRSRVAQQSKGRIRLAMTSLFAVMAIGGAGLWRLWDVQSGWTASSLLHEVKVAPLREIGQIVRSRPNTMGKMASGLSRALSDPNATLDERIRCAQALRELGVSARPFTPESVASMPNATRLQPRIPVPLAVTVGWSHVAGQGSAWAGI